MNSNNRPFKDDSLLQIINSNFVSLRDQDILRNNKILHPVLKEVLKTLKERNEFCRAFLSGDIAFAGSFYKGTKVGKPEEFDLNVIIQLPLKYELIQFENDKPGFIKLKVSKECYKPEWENHKQLLAKLVNREGYLDQDEFRRCMGRALANIPQTVTIAGQKFELKLKESGPAFTLCVKQENSLEMCVDLVPVLEFKRQPRISENVGTESWFAIPKSGRNIADPHLYWRMSFYRHEQVLLKKYQHLKPVIKLLKKLRDTQNWNVLVSYHIETLVLHRIKTMDRKPDNSLTEDFVDMLREMKKACESKKIANYWDRSHNLIANVEPAQLANIASRLDTMLKEIEKNSAALANYILTKEECNSRF